MDGLKNLVTIKEASLKLQGNKFDLLYSTGVINKILDLSKNSEVRIVQRAVSLIVDVSELNHAQIEDCLVKNNIFKRLKLVIKNYPKNMILMKQSFLIVSNLIVGDNHELTIKKLIKSGLLKTILNVLENKSFEKVWTEAARVLSKVVEFSNILMRIQIENKFILSKQLALMLQNSKGNNKIQMNVLQTIPHILDIDKFFFSDKVSPKIIFKNNGGVDCLKYLQNKSCRDTFFHSNSMVENYYPEHR